MKGNKCLIAGHFLRPDLGLKGSGDGNGRVDRDAKLIGSVIEHTLVQGSRPDESGAHHRHGRHDQQQGHLRAQLKVIDDAQFNNSLSGQVLVLALRIFVMICTQSAVQAAFIASTN
jgi:hypothetical protein